MTRLLIVEDDPIIAADLRLAMNKMGYEVLDTVESGEEAIARVQQDRPDLILMDIKLEGDLDGIDTAHQISRIASTPVIYLTSNTDETTFNRAKLTQPHGFLSKPFRRTDIKHAIDLVFNAKPDSPVNDLEESQITRVMDESIFVKSKEHLHKVMLKDILFVEADSCYCTIVTKHSRHTIVGTLKKFDAAVSGTHLIRVHRSYMINLLHISKIGDTTVYIGSQAIPLGRSYRESLFSQIKRF